MDGDLDNQTSNPAENQEQAENPNDEKGIKLGIGTDTIVTRIITMDNGRLFVIGRGPNGEMKETEISEA